MKLLDLKHGLALCLILQPILSAAAFAPAPAVIKPVVPAVPKAPTNPGGRTGSGSEGDGSGTDGEGESTGTDGGGDTIGGLGAPAPAPVPKPKPVVPETGHGGSGETPPENPQDIYEPAPTGIGQYLSNNKQAPFADLHDAPGMGQLNIRASAIINAEIVTKAIEQDVPAEQNPDQQQVESVRVTHTYTSVHTVNNVARTISSYSTETVDPTRPTAGCIAWRSLADYCSGAGTDCNCYSGTYYVPDQWNSLAAACGRYNNPSGNASFADDAQSALSSTSYCAVANVTSVAFGAVTPATTSATTTTDTDVSSTFTSAQSSRTSAAAVVTPTTSPTFTAPTASTNPDSAGSSLGSPNVLMAMLTVFLPLAVWQVW